MPHAKGQRTAPYSYLQKRTNESNKNTKKEELYFILFFLHSAIKPINFDCKLVFFWGTNASNTNAIQTDTICILNTKKRPPIRSK
ncbi:hypothetical protein ES332_A05G384400v1 [Gossypium tomentosum]|uniref:Uncharacterized protein n=1 Tax=Gossypium tomentosum TaxID=34277 RepID=A0A5D2QP42_GOSTO|nr:hypothetical protein ES332_A05G384400v1 [Gossypium tomentosum]